MINGFQDWKENYYNLNVLDVLIFQERWKDGWIKRKENGIGE